MRPCSRYSSREGLRGARLVAREPKRASSCEISRWNEGSGSDGGSESHSHGTVPHARTVIQRRPRRGAPIVTAQEPLRSVPFRSPRGLSPTPSILSTSQDSIHALPGRTDRRRIPGKLAKPTQPTVLPQSSVVRSLRGPVGRACRSKTARACGADACARPKGLDEWLGGRWGKGG